MEKIDIDVIEYDKTIYKKDSSNKIRILHVYTEGADVIKESGVKDGKLVVYRSTSKGKNIGKSNETTPEEQARLEAARKIQTKLDKEYFDTEEEAVNMNVVLPMLAKDYNKEKNVDYPCYVQPKLDGMRALADFNKIISREGKEVTTLDHIQKSLIANKKGLDLPDDYMLDGELYAHGKDFQENMKLIKKYVPGKTEEVKYHIYDLVGGDHKFETRIDALRVRIENIPHVELVPTYKVQTEEEMLEYHEKFIALGYEGTMIRHTRRGYSVNKRCSQLLKYKDFKDISAEIVDVIPSDKRPKQAVFVCEYNGKRFNTGMKYSHKDREKILVNKADYIGKKEEIRFFEYTQDGIPRFPVAVGTRLDK